MKKVIAIKVFDMKEKQTFGIQFVGRKDREKEKHFTIFARITVNREVSEISLKQEYFVDRLEPGSRVWERKKSRDKGAKSIFGSGSDYLSCNRKPEAE